VRKIKALTVRMGTVILSGKGRQNPTCFVYYVFEINSNIFFRRSFIFEGGRGVLD
jgi:hypothetical protein